MTNRRHGLNGQSRVRPRRLMADVCGPHQESEGPANFGGKLQSAKGVFVQMVAANPRRNDARGAQGLIDRPQGIGLVLRVYEKYAV